MVLINRNFTLLWTGQLISQLGDKAYNIVLMWWLFEKTSSSLVVSSFLITSMLPELLFAPLAGVYIDRWNKKRILAATDFIRGIIVLLLAALYQSKLLTVWHVYSAALCISLCSALFNPATMSIVPMVVKKNELQQANTLSQMVTGAVAIIGPLLGASSVALIGYMGVLVFNSFSYILSGIAEAFLQIAPLKGDRAESVQSSLVKGFTYIREDIRVLVIVIIVAAIHIFVGSLMVIMPFLANSIKGNGIHNLGILQAAFGGGLLFGAVYLSNYTRNNTLSSLYLCYAMVCMGVGIASLGLLQFISIHLLEVYAAACIVIGICVTVISVLWRTIAQICVPEELTGRVFSVLSTTGNISLPISMGLFGIVLNYVTFNIVLTFAGFCLIFMGIVFICNSRTIFSSMR